MLTIRYGKDRGQADLGWLKTHYTFSFAQYHDPKHMGFSVLRVINDDIIAPGGGFGDHGHRDMEIITYVLEGALQHRDSLGTGSVIHPGEVQKMSAGTGIVHSEFNASQTQPVHLLQIWIVPDRQGVAPGYEQKPMPLNSGKLRLIASREGREGSVTLNQDATLHAGRLAHDNEVIHHPLAPGRHGYVHVARGEVTVNGVALSAGDGVAAVGEPILSLTSSRQGEVLVFDLP